jgi:hypothetical protein
VVENRQAAVDHFLAVWRLPGALLYPHSL